MQRVLAFDVDQRHAAAEVVVRVAFACILLLVLVRLAGKREIGELSPMEFLSMLLLSET